MVFDGGKAGKWRGEIEDVDLAGGFYFEDLGDNVIAYEIAASRD